MRRNFSIQALFKAFSRIVLLTILMLAISMFFCACNPKAQEAQEADTPNSLPDDVSALPGELQAESILETRFFPEGQDSDSAYSQITVKSLFLAPENKSPVVDRINNELAAVLEELVFAISDEEAAMYAADSSVSFSHDISYSLHYYDEQVVSIISDIYTPATASAHEELLRYAYNYDLKTGERLKLADILGKDFMETMVSHIYKRVNEANELQHYYENLEQQLVENFSENQWYMDSENVYVVYQSYQIAPYSWGMRIFDIPLAKQ